MIESVTVIIPVLNVSNSVGEVLMALKNQTYPEKLIEIIIVDNGSTDSTVAICNSFGVNVLEETSVKSPYAARNLGLKNASGEIIALTDSNKVPDSKWIEKGVEALNRNEAHLAGGNILFRRDDLITASEIYDSLTFNNNRRLVMTEGGSAAGNLFFRRQITEIVGLFPGEFRSGMDIWWTQKAVRNGFCLCFAAGAVVWCKPRKLKDLVKKSYRVGLMHPYNYYESGLTVGEIFMTALRTFAPPRLQLLKEKIEVNGINYSIVKVCTVSWISKIAMAFGRIEGLARLGHNLQKEKSIAAE